MKIKLINLIIFIIGNNFCFSQVNIPEKVLHAFNNKLITVQDSLDNTSQKYFCYLDTLKFPIICINEALFNNSTLSDRFNYNIKSNLDSWTYFAKIVKDSLKKTSGNDTLYKTLSNEWEKRIEIDSLKYEITNTNHINFMFICKDKLNNFSFSVKIPNKEKIIVKYLLLEKAILKGTNTKIRDFDRFISKDDNRIIEEYKNIIIDSLSTQTFTIKITNNTINDVINAFPSLEASVKSSLPKIIGTYYCQKELICAIENNIVGTVTSGLVEAIYKLADKNIDKLIAYCEELEYITQYFINDDISIVKEYHNYLITQKRFNYEKINN